MKKRVIWISVSAVVVLTVVFLICMKFVKSTPMQFQTDCAKIDSIEVTVTATGEIQPVYKVEVGTQVSGIVEKLYVDYNSVVTKGQLLAELDRSTLQEQVTQSEASLSNAESNLTLARQSYDRVKSLYDNKAATLESFEAGTNELIKAQNEVLTAKSNLQKAQVNLSYAQIYSPISGVILNKEVEQGQTVAASFSTPTLFTIANDLTRMQVEADVDEADIGQVKVGQLVTFTVDAFPDDVFDGKVNQVRLEPTVTSNVVTYTVIIEAPNPDEKLFPGMTANVSIIVDKQVGIAVPMEALYFSLDNDAKTTMTKAGYQFKELFNNQEDIANSLKDVTKKSLWIKKGNIAEQKSVTTGLNDGVKSLIVSGVSLGDEVILNTVKVQNTKKQKEKDGSNPFMMGPPERKTR